MSVIQLMGGAESKKYNNVTSESVVLYCSEYIREDYVEARFLRLLNICSR